MSSLTSIAAVDAGAAAAPERKQALVLSADRTLRQLVVPVLTAQEIVVFEAEDLAEACELLAFETLHLAVVDGQLPDGAGEMIVPKLRENSAEARLIFVTDFHQDLRSYRRLTGELGANLVIRKPLDPAAISTQLGGVLEASSAPAPERKRELKPEVRARLEAMRKAYRGVLREKVDMLRRALTPLIEGETPSPEKLARARHLAHTIAGTAGTYGYKDVGELALEIEQALTGVGAGRRPRTGFWELGEALDGARAALVAGGDAEDPE